MCSFQNNGMFSIARLTSFHTPPAYVSEPLKLNRVFLTDKPNHVYFVLNNCADIVSNFYIYTAPNQNSSETDSEFEAVDKIVFCINGCWSYKVSIDDMMPFLRHKNLIVFPFKFVLLSLAMMYSMYSPMAIYFRVVLKDSFTVLNSPDINMSCTCEYVNDRKDVAVNPEKYIGRLFEVMYYTTLDNLPSLINKTYIKHLHIFDLTTSIFSATFLFKNGLSYTWTVHDSTIAKYNSSTPFNPDMFYMNNLNWSSRDQLENVLIQNQVGETLELSGYKVMATTVQVHKYADGMIEIISSKVV